MKYLIYSFFLSIFLIGCGSSPELKSKDIPKWAINQPDLCGLGVYKTKGNFGTDKRFSIAHGRLDLSGQIETKVRSMIKLYASSGELEGEDFTEDLTRLAAVNLSKTTINGSIPVKIKIVGNNVFTLVCLKPGKLTEAIGEMGALNKAQRKYLQRKSDIAHQELRDQMENYND
jgi:hypothetical protein